MSTISYNKKIFNNIYSIEELEKSINQELPSSLNTINNNEDDMDFIFTIELDQNEKNILDNIVKNHHQVFRDYQLENKSTLQLLTVRQRIRSKNYTDFASFYYDGYLSGMNLVSIRFVARGENYSVRLYDSTNNKILSEKSFNNKNYEEFILDNFTNIPLRKSILDLQIKNTSSLRNLFIKTAQLTYTTL